MKAFYDALRESFGPLAQNQVEGIEILLKATEGLPRSYRAYVLATAWHETGPASSKLHMTPRREIWGPTAAQKGYEGRADLGNTVKGDGLKFAGRGYVQITGRRNYQKASALVGQDLVANPDLALQPEIAAKIIVHGMTFGWFTGKKMSDYATFQNMRRVVNGTDQAALIAGYAAKFSDALAKVADAPAPKPPPPNDEPVLRPPADIPPPETKPGPTIAGWILAALFALIAAAAAYIVKGN